MEASLARFVVFVALFGAVSGVLREAGNIGCLYTQLCLPEEVCMDDSLFGICSSGDSRSTSPIYINVQQALELEYILSLLVDNEYPWESEYVQCILKEYLKRIKKKPEAPEFPERCNKEEEERRRNQNFNDKLGGVLEEDEDEYGMDGERSAGSRMGGRFHGEANQAVDRESWREKDLNNFASTYRTGSNSFDKGSYGRDESAIERAVERMGVEGARRVEEGMFRAEKTDESTATKFDVRIDPSGATQTQASINKGNFNVPGRYMVTIEKPLPSLPAPLPDYLKHFYKPSTRPLYKTYSDLDLPSAPAKEVVRTEPIDRSRLSRSRQKYLVTMYILCGFIVIATFLAVVLYLVRRRAKFREKFLKWVNKVRQDSTGDYQDLCRQHMQSKFSEKTLDSPMTPPASRHHPIRTPSTNSSSSSWNEEASSSNLDISTGHLILSYMEDHMRDKERLQREWDELSNNDPEPCSIVAGIEPANMRKNRCTDILPYEHTRVRLDPANNISGSDYINANFIVDNDPRNPTYIISQGPLPHTVADFWQMVWEQNSVVIVNLTRLVDNGTPNCHRYWPEEGTELYHIYEVQLISEHVLCEDFVVRSLLLKCIQTTETRTVTQFHLSCWSSLSVPPYTKVLLDFRRKVNKSYRSKMSPIVVHCGDGAGRSGTYCLIDMTLNRLNKGAKEINIAAGLEHLRDQRVNLVRTKDQFEYALTAIAEEVQCLLNVPHM